ncbi:MAG TPA: hypothetical protein DDW52_21360 [Planctomycetaceae bacterium]|nr:hypothetical protein [Planctomycetaceae bacterium]
MNRLVTILRAAHCRSTHHYLAIDAIEHITTVAGSCLGQLLLKYHDEYLVGAKAPDKSFRDFQNHVLHVGDNNWGGAPKAAEKWLAQAIEYLDGGRWKKAAYACGVLSHYVTDPFMPLHTAQSQREAVVHRPMEWSVCKAYDDIANRCENIAQNVRPIEVPPTDAWISSVVVQGAKRGHAYYHTVIDEYDVQLGCRRPTEGASERGKNIFAELLWLASTTWGKCLTRIADETTAEIPKFPMTLTTFLATIDMPLAWITRRISDATEQRAVKAILREYEATGTVRRHLPTEIRQVAIALEKSRAIEKNTTESQTPNLPSNPSPAIAESSAHRMPAPAPASVSQTPPNETNASGDSSPNSRTQSQSQSPTRRSGRIVSRDSELVDAPSIGPKTAKRFAKIGIDTIGQFLDRPADQMRLQLDTSWITESLLTEWQDQAQLVCDLPLLCGYKAQLLVAADCRASAQLASSQLEDLHIRIREVCHSIDGQRILRSAKPPTKPDIASWIDAAQHAQSGRTAA